MHLDDTFFEEAGLSGISAERKAELSQQVGELAENRMIAELSEHLNDEQLEHFDKLADSDGNDAALAYLQSQMPDFKQVMEEVNQKVIQDFMSDLKVLTDQAAA